MLTQSRLDQKNIAQITVYLSQDNYYTQAATKENSYWYGEGAQDLGLSGQVEKKIFAQLLSGLVGGQQLGRTTEQGILHRPGIDLTFSAPKSLSILSEVFQDDQALEAHHRAIKSTLDHIEKALIQTRVFSDGASRRVRPGKAIFALFTHDISRELDPSLHTHCVLLNATKTDRGWRSIMNDVFHDREMILRLGQLYRMNLAHELVGLGYALKPNASDPTLFEVAGVPAALIARFSKRAEQIRSFIEERGFDYAPALAKRVSMLTRKRKQSIPRDELRALWKEQLTGISFDLSSIIKQEAVIADSGLERQAVKAPGIRALIKQAIAHLLERDMGFTDKELQEAAAYFGLGRYSGSQILSEIERMKAAGTLSPARDYADGDRVLWTTGEAKRLERDLIDIVSARDTVRTAFNPAAARRAFSKTTLNDQQKQAIEAALRSTSRYFAIQGDPGVGKTTALRVFKQLVQHSGYDVLGLASTYQAVGELSNSLSIKGLTVARYLVDPNRKRFHETQRPQAWIVDEPGMLTTETIIELMRLAKTQNARVLFAGDHQQLESVGAGRGFKQLLEAGIDHAVMNKRMRQKTDYMKSVVAEVMKKNYTTALDLLDGHERVVSRDSEHDATQALTDEWLRLGQAEREATLIVTPTNEQRRDVCLAVRSGLLAEQHISGPQIEVKAFNSVHRTKEEKQHAHTYQVGQVVRFDKDIAYDKKITLTKGEYYDVIGINAQANTLALRARSNKRVVVIDTKRKNMAAGGALQLFEEASIQLARGDQLRWTDNKNELGLKRNTAMVVQLVTSSFIRVKTEEGESLKINIQRKANRHFVYDYARTVYGVQGKTNKRVLALMTSWRRNTTHQRSFMVSVTRASHDVKLFTDEIGKLKRSLHGRSGDNAEALTGEEFMVQKGRKIQAENAAPKLNRSMT